MKIISLALLIAAFVLFVIATVTPNSSKLVSAGLAAWTLSEIVTTLPGSK